MPIRNNKNGISLMDFFKNRAIAQAEAAASKEIPEVLKKCNDVLSQNNYEVSMKARVWFREHSNINDVLDKYIVMNELVNPNKNTYISCVIRASLNMSVKRRFPYNTFKFNSRDAEIIGKFLLLHPEIKEEPDMETVQNYFRTKNVKLCLVDMSYNNEINDNIQKLLNRKREKYGSENLPLHHKTVIYDAMCDYYHKTKTVENINIHDLTVEEMCQISNFEKVVRNEMKDKQLPDETYTYFADYLLKVFKEDPKVRVKCDYFVVKPKYNLIGYNITEKQVMFLTDSVKNFYNYSNAYDVLRPLKRKYEEVLDPTLDRIAKKKDMRMRFFMGYVKQKDKNLFPYHNLYWTGEEDFEMPASPEIDTLQPSTSQKFNQFTYTYKQRKLCEKYPTKVPESIESSNDSTVVEVITSNANNQVINHSRLTEPMLLKTPNPHTKEMQLIEFLAVIKEFVIAFRGIIVQEFPRNHEILWKEKRKVFINYILHKLKQDPASLRESIEMIPPPMKNDAIILLEEAAQEPDLNESFEPLKTSTQQMNDIIPDIGAIEEILNEEIEGAQPVAPVILENVKIKQEILSPQILPQLTNDSDVMCLGQVNNEEVITIADSDEDDYVKMLESDNIQMKDKFQLRINQESQRLSENSPPEQQLNSQTSSRAEFDLHLNHFEAVDQQQALREKNQVQKRRAILPKRTSPRNKKAKKNDQSFRFTDNSSQEELEIQHNKKPPFTFVRHTSNHQPSDFGASCFFVEFQRITYKRQLNIFEVSFNLPQFSCYDVILKTHSDIKIFFNLSELEWETLTNNLYVVGDYKFEKKGTASKILITGYENSIKKQLDLYFSTISPFKVFQLYSDGHDFSCTSLTRSNLNENTTNAVDQNMLNLISLQKN